MNECPCGCEADECEVDASEVVRDWLDRQRMKPCPPTREQVEFVELMIDDMEART